PLAAARSLLSPTYACALGAASPSPVTFVSPRSIQQSSQSAHFQATFLVEVIGIPSLPTSQRSAGGANALKVPVPVRSSRLSPSRTTWCSSSSYVRMFMIFSSFSAVGRGLRVSLTRGPFFLLYTVRTPPG